MTLVAWTASPQRFVGRLLLSSRHIVMFKIVMFRLFATPFFCGVYGCVSCCVMP